MQRPHVPRGLAVLSVYVAFFLALAGIGFLLANPISDQVRTFTNHLPQIVNEANRKIATFQRELQEHGIHLKLVKQGKTALQSIQDKVAKSAAKLASFGGALATEAANAIFDLVLVFVLSVYMLIYGRQIGHLARRLMPDGDGSRADDYPTLVQHAVARYIGGQLLFSTVMGASAGPVAVAVRRPWHLPRRQHLRGRLRRLLRRDGARALCWPDPRRPASGLVALFMHPITAVWVALLFVGLQQLEGHVVAPQIFGHTLRINPLLVIFALLLGLQLHGIVGALIALPILPILRETTVYLNRHLAFEPWKRGSDGLL